MKTLTRCAIVLCILLGTNSCSMTRHYTTRSELRQSSGRVLILTRDSSKYYLDRFILKDSTMEGTGTREHRNSAAKFNGEISIREMTYIIGSPSINFWDVVGFVGVLATTASSLGALDGPSSSVSAYEYPEPTVGSSCPTLYAWNGAAYQLDGEAFGTALGKALELETATVMRSLQPADDRLRIRISNERPETHYLNSVRLLSVSHPLGSKVVLDTRNQPWSTSDLSSPIAARDHSGRSVADLIGRADGQSWHSDLATARPGSTFRDELIVEFEPTRSHKAGIVIRAMNSQLSAVVFRQLYQLLGNEAIDFIRAAENDPAMIALLKKWLYTASLHVSLWTHGGWKHLDTILPEASEAQFERLVMLDNEDVGSDRLILKLSSLADVWEIDAVTTNRLIDGPLPMVPATMLSSQGPRQFTTEEVIARCDSTYLLLWPGDHLFLEYEQTKRIETESITYVLSAKGYLYEWPSANHVFGNQFAHTSPGKNLALARMLLENEQMLLPLIFEEWRKEKP